MARWLVKILKTLINTGESGIVYCMECRKYVGLTLTWDVLKLYNNVIDIINSERLTLTWDVLKLCREGDKYETYRINFNMGCIETAAGTLTARKQPGLTLTWDVLKLSQTAAAGTEPKD